VQRAGQRFGRSCCCRNGQAVDACQSEANLRYFEDPRFELRLQQPNPTVPLDEHEDAKLRSAAHAEAAAVACRAVAISCR